MLVCFFLLAFRVGYLQLLEHQQLADQADQRSIRTQVVPTNRAMITDRNDEALAVSVSSKDIVLIRNTFSIPRPTPATSAGRAWPTC